MKTKFELVDRRIILTTRIYVWDLDFIEEKQDVTDKVSVAFNDYLTHQLHLDDYKYENVTVIYIGKDKDRYRK